MRHGKRIFMIAAFVLRTVYGGELKFDATKYTSPAVRSLATQAFSDAKFKGRRESESACDIGWDLRDKEILLAALFNDSGSRVYSVKLIRQLQPSLAIEVFINALEDDEIWKSKSMAGESLTAYSVFVSEVLVGVTALTGERVSSEVALDTANQYFGNFPRAARLSLSKKLRALAKQIK